MFFPTRQPPFGQRVRTRLQNDTLIWIVTVGADGRQPNPAGFCRDSDADSAEFVIYSRPDARRLKHLISRGHGPVALEPIDPAPSA